MSKNKSSTSQRQTSCLVLRKCTGNFLRTVRFILLDCNRVSFANAATIPNYKVLLTKAAEKYFFSLVCLLNNFRKFGALIERFDVSAPIDFQE